MACDTSSPAATTVTSTPTPKSASYSIPIETQSLFWNGIVKNDLINTELSKCFHDDAELQECASKVKFQGSATPCIPINWRFAESVSALKGLEGMMVNLLLKRKYGDVGVQDVVVDVDQAQLYFMSVLLFTLDPGGPDQANPSFSLDRAKDGAIIQKYFPDWDKHQANGSLYRECATNIYKTKDNRFFHLHGSMNPTPSMESIGLPPFSDLKDRDEIIKTYQDRMLQFTASEIQELASETYKQAGTICWSPEEFLASEHYAANSHIGLYEIHHRPNPTQKPSWWPDSTSPTLKTTAARPLAGLKVVDLTRVIAGPSMSKGLAELGASVMRIVAPHITDYAIMHCDLNWGKWNSTLDLRTEEGRASLRALIADADVVVSGYRPGVLDKYGFSADDIFAICADRDRGLIYARENCYGWRGPWAHRSGWQQISDACCGVSVGFGRAMGLADDEPVTPVFPNSDYCTGIVGVTSILDAIIRRSEVGGSFLVDLALNYYSAWLVKSVGEYPADVWDELWSQNGRRVFRCTDDMRQTLPVMFGALAKQNPPVVFKDEYFEVRKAENLGISIRTPKPILQFPQGKVELGFNVGTRTNGIDKPVWPEDLATEVVV